MTSAVSVIGTGITRFAKQLDRSVKSLAQEAAEQALKESGVAHDQIDLVVFGSAMSGLITGQEMIRGQAAFNGTALSGTPTLNTENACASGAAAVHIGRMAIASGQYNRVLVVCAEKLADEDRAKTAAALNSGLDMDQQATLMEAYSAGSGAFMMDIYAEITRGYMASSGATIEDLARVSVKNRANAANNPMAQYQDPVSLDGVMSSRTISDPITLLMCSPVADGAAALVLARGDDHPGAVPIAATAIATSVAGDTDSSPTTQAAAEAFSIAGITAADLGAIEIHDASAPAELIAYEELGLCPAGESPRLIRDGETLPSGRVPVNVNGGLLGRGHPVGATGGAQLVELVRQMRGDAGSTQLDRRPRWTLAENHGGYLHPHPAVAAVTILGS